jgi:eukaryotic-like serine/threonine-protein kinase
MFWTISYMPTWIFYWLVAVGVVSFNNMPFMWTAYGSFYIIIGLLFTTARKQNGLAGLHDLVTRTRVIRKPKLETRPALPLPDIQPVAESESMPRLGAYYVLEKLEQGKDEQWLLAYDARLLRKIWIHVVPEGTPDVDDNLRSLRRVGRLRWISGRRSGNENWDAFEAPGGAPLLDLAAKPQPWEFVRFWLFDLAQELAAASKDGTLPKTLSLDRVWINSEGRAKILDFPAPGLNDSKRRTGTSDPGLFLVEVAAASLEGRPDRPAEDPVRAPIPLHARRFLEDKRILSNPESAVQDLKRLIQRPACVTRTRRLALVACCLIIPLSSVIVTLNMLLKSAKDQAVINEMLRVNLVLAVGYLLLYVAIPSMIAALAFRGGLALRVCGVGVVRKDGRAASRIRVFWRSVLTWGMLFIPAAAGAIWLNPFDWRTGTMVLVILMMAGLTVWSTLLPDRGIPDRLSGTRLVPR